MAVFADGSNGTNAPAASGQTGLATGPFSSLPERLTATRDGRRLLQKLDLEAGEIAGLQFLTVGAEQGACAVHTERLRQGDIFIGVAQRYVSEEPVQAIREEKARNSNAIYVELCIDLGAIARTGCRRMGSVLERGLDTSRSGSLLDRFGR
jgi:hypothetical protein